MTAHCCPEGRWLADSAPTTRSIYAPNLDELIEAPLADLFWGVTEFSAVNEAIARADAMIRHLEIRRSVIEKQISKLSPVSSLECAAA
ncbi:MAG: hypothetical protein FJ405_04740 [Verrucomicrobia bacterium]|nr:hypothetical protein [Verrucomicrobiota bacterium]